MNCYKRVSVSYIESLEIKQAESPHLQLIHVIEPLGAKTNWDWEMIPVITAIIGTFDNEL